MGKTILIIFTGGTITMSSDEMKTKSILHDNHLELLEKIRPKIPEAEFEFILYSVLPSPSITPNDMLEIGKIIDREYKNKKIDGVVITHGTDTLEETAYFLDLYTDLPIPIVLTGSMRSFDEFGYDGLSNLISAILVALDPNSADRGVLVCLNDEINSAVEVQKTHTIALDTFKSLEFGPLGIVDERTVHYYREATYKNETIKPTSINKKVEIVKVVSGSDGEIIDYYIDKGVNGLVIEALGRGNVTVAVANKIKDAIANNIAVVITSRCPMGMVKGSYSYEGGGYHLRKLGTLSGSSLTSEKARLKLLLALSANLDPKDYF
jgi:L-asparaginase